MQKVFLYLSAFIPLYCLIIIKLLLEIINQNLSFNVLNSFMLILLFLLIILGIFGVYKESKCNAKEIITIEILEKTSITEQHFLGYFSLFVLFALNFQLEKVSMFVIFIIITILIGIVYIKNNLFYINPMLNILGYNFYEIKYIDEKGEIKHNKFFYHGNINALKKCIVKIGDKNFNYIYKNKKWVLTHFLLLPNILFYFFSLIF